MVSFRFSRHLSSFLNFIHFPSCAVNVLYMANKYCIVLYCMVNLNGTYHYKMSSCQKEPPKFDLPLTHLQKIRMVYPLMTISRKILISSPWQHGDVRKMFNQILVHPKDQVYHRFPWRSKTSDHQLGSD